MPIENWFLKYVQGSRKGSEREGVLMRIEENEHSRYEFEVWFEYTRHAMNDIREGTMMAVPNYASTKDETHASVLEVTSLKPIHYAIGEKPEGFPGFVLEAAKNAAIDWTGQDDEPTEDTTTIRCTAIPTNLELFEAKDGSRKFESEENLPMVGAVVRILDTDPTIEVVNQNIDRQAEKDKLFQGGTLIRDPKVPVFVRTEEFLRLHFGIFGFTGAGKSNLLSTYIAKLMKSQTPVKIVLFDLMGEYTGLLIDLLNDPSLERAQVIALGDQTLPGPVVSFLKGERGAPTSEDASEFLNRTTLLPSDLQRHKSELKIALKKLLDDGKVKIFSKVENLTIWYLFYDYKNNKFCPLSYKRRQKTELREKRKQIISAVLHTSLKKPRDYKDQKEYKKIVLSKELAEDLLNSLNSELSKPEHKDFRDGADFEGVINQIQNAIPLLGHNTPASVSMTEILSDLNDDTSKSSLYVITAHDSDEIRRFAASIGEEIYESRRRSGGISPLVSFIFDEADEFIPLNAAGTQEDSKAIIRTLARRGRKFGIGFGIATQRVRHLDTSIMAQPHTYLVSKLPRQSDREVVAEAFGVSADMFRQTFKFKPGNWLIMSHDATGLKAVPIPLTVENANERIKTYLEPVK
jgi:DNA helicase HerA-like ATPase